MRVNFTRDFTKIPDLTGQMYTAELVDVDKDGFIDWDEFLALMMEARSSYYKSLFKTYDLNEDNQIDKSEMETIVAQIKARG